MEISQMDSLLEKIYGSDPGTVLKQKGRYKELAGLYREKFGEEEPHFFSTPGRTEIGGNHTDHNYGRVLAGSINLDSIAVAAANGSERVKVYSMGYESPFEVALDRLEPGKDEYGTTTSLIRGIAARLKELGYKIGGFNAYITSDVLPGSGLSSSASIEVLIGNIISSLFNEDRIEPEVLAITGQYAENNFFGKPCGLMDQVACAMGGIVTIDFKDPQNPEIRKVDFDFAAQDYSMIVVDTGGTHADLTDDYASVPTEMKSVAEALGSSVVREIELNDLMAGMSEVRAKTGDRAVLRALHFLGDNARVTKQVAALENNDFKAFLGMITDSGNSSYKRLQNIYSPSNVGEQGVALALSLTENFLEEIGEGACRVHGGGFAGTIQIFLPNRAVEAYAAMMKPVFGEDAVHALKIRALGTLHLKP
ncbi:MAG: galactokinase family protein [Bacteroides sp.]|nr:galactokinase family protein [Bacteroides sp.]